MGPYPDKLGVVEEGRSPTCWSVASRIANIKLVEDPPTLLARADEVIE